MRLEGRVAIVTGGSRGIGACIARRFGAEGARIAVVAHTQRAKADEVVREIADAGGQAEAFQADVSIVADCERLAGEVAAAFGTIDILVNNAGVLLMAPIEETTEADWDSLIDVNLKGTFFMTKAVLPFMKAKSAGKIINIASSFGNVGAEQASVYCASKGGLINLTRAMCLELAPLGINVNALAPGGVATDMTDALRAQPGLQAELDRMTPGGSYYMGPDDLSGAAVFFASDESDRVHGAHLVVDGGWTAH